MSIPDQDMADRLRLARERLFDTAAEAAAAMKIPIGTYSTHENGACGFRRPAPRYAKFFRVRLEWLLTGHGEMDSDRLAELIRQLPNDQRPEAENFVQFLIAKAK
jgi:hypothetical protein